MERDHPQSEFLVEKLGVGLYGPQVPWNGGVDYLQQLQLRVAGGDLPDMFAILGGLEYDLAEQGALARLDEYLPEYAPTLYELVPEHIWDIVRANSPDGGIYYLPSTWVDISLAGFIRYDWLERVGLGMPQTIDEYRTVLEAFRDQDANGNGDPDDELPTSGRENARWMDHLFAPFEVALWEGYPMWDLYDGELTYSAVTPNMKDALEWIAGLYGDGLLDQETLLNTSSTWNAKIRSDRVGSWYHGPMWLMSTLSPIHEINPDVDLRYLPPVSAPGYEGSYSSRQYAGPSRAIAAGDEEKIIAALRVVEYYSDPRNVEEIAHGYEGLDYVVEDGQEVRIALPADMRGAIGAPIITKQQQITKNFSYIEEGPLVPLADMITRIILDSDSEPIAGQGLPPSIYDGYADIKNHSLYHEYASLIIAGEYSIDRFDEFVKRWYDSGGDVVTRRAREYYQSLR
jgi:putative aldouronate transport system substrate-binding protein